MGRSRRFFAALVVLGLTSIVSLTGAMLGSNRAEASSTDQALEGAERWKNLIEEAADESGVPPEVIAAMMTAGSGGETSRHTAVGGVGLMELRPAWQPSARNLGSDLTDPSTNVHAAATVLSEGYAAWGSWSEAAAAYVGMLDSQGNLVDAEDGTSAEAYLARFHRNLAALGFQESVPGESPDPSADPAMPAGIRALKHALSTQGTPYVYGGESYGEGGFDCSGLMQWAYDKAGKSLPRSASAQWQAATQVDREQMVPGDLIFFAGTYASGITHVAMYAGDGLMIHAPQASEPIQIEPISSPYWESRIAGFGTVQ